MDRKENGQREPLRGENGWKVSGLVPPSRLNTGRDEERKGKMTMKSEDYNDLQDGCMSPVTCEATAGAGNHDGATAGSEVRLWRCNQARPSLRTRCSGGGVTRTMYYGCCVGFSIGDQQHGGHSLHRLGNLAWRFLDALDTACYGFFMKAFLMSFSLCV